MEREILKGKLQGNERGYAFLLTEEGGEDYFIAHGDLKGAMHGDSVICEKTRGGERTAARVLKITERGIKQLVGTYFSCKGGGFVRPDDGRYFTDIFVPFGKGVRAKAGDKVVCRILSYPPRRNPEGIVCKILGRQFERKAELRSILYGYDLKEEFSMSAAEEAAGFSDRISETDLKGREDFRNITAVTIDGADARDFDDAVSVEKNDKGYVLGVHIADVSHYVKSDSALDYEAFERGTSVYFPEKVIPMLPERLCNDLCSLKEGKDRLTLSCVTEIGFDGKVCACRIVPSVIRSAARLTYEEVQKIFDGDEEAAKKRAALTENLFLMKELAELLAGVRDKNGSIDLDVKESAIYVDKKGNIEIRPAPRDMARRLIEEFMIIANCTVAEYMYYLSVPFIYRIHERPTEEKLENFYAFLDGIGISARHKKDEIYPMDFRNILKKSEDSDVFFLVNRVMLRSMQKAIYSPRAEGHFGLGVKHYCHFTSPIRRYPDLAIHRIIKDVLLNGTDAIAEKYSDFVDYASKQSSEREKNAEAAERAVDDFYKILYIGNYEGEEFDGVISGVANFGLFVELENGVEGLVKSETLKGRRYRYDQTRYTLSDGRKTYRLGEKVRIKVAGVNIVDRRAEFVLADMS